MSDKKNILNLSNSLISSDKTCSADIIAISGFGACGKNTVSHIVAKMLGWVVVEPTFKTLAKREGISLIEFQKRANLDFDIDKKFDEALKDECKNKKCVIATWLGPWMSPRPAFKVWLDVPLQIRAKRILNRDKFSNIQDALNHLKTRDKDNVLRYKKIYQIDITNHDNFDLVIDASNISAKEVAEQIVKTYKLHVA